MSKKTKCKRCGDKETIEHYHDAGDHFGAGSSPLSEWQDIPCPECERMTEVKAHNDRIKEMKKTVKPAIAYAKSLDW